MSGIIVVEEEREKESAQLWLSRYLKEVVEGRELRVLVGRHFLLCLPWHWHHDLLSALPREEPQSSLVANNFSYAHVM